MTNPVAVSFEFFPPSDEGMGQQLWEAVQRLAPLQPNFVSVTYGADGSTRSRTHECVLRILRETDLTVAPHLTCVGAARAEVLRIAQDYWQQGVRHLVALRGDAPASQQSPDGRYRPQDGGFAYASDLVAGLASVGKFEVSVAAYPEGHPESGSVEADLENLQAQGRCGRRTRHHAVLLRHGRVSALSRSLRGRPAFACRWCRASCRSRAFRNCCASPGAAAHPCRTGCGSASTDWTMIRRHAA